MAADPQGASPSRPTLSHLIQKHSPTASHLKTTSPRTSYNDPKLGLPMSVGFGFSAGDFIAALELVATVIGALRDSGESSAEYRELISQLFTLKTALLAVKRVELEDVQHAEVVALQ